MIVEIAGQEIPFHRSIQGLCRHPFYGHAAGCPNYGKKEGCPPVPLIGGVLDLEREALVIYTPFAVGEFAERMRRSHPEWEGQPRQWYNPRRWQPTARKVHHAEELRARLEFGVDSVIGSPEANGVDVTALMAGIGVRLAWDWPPSHENYNKILTYQVSLGGWQPKK